MLGYTQGDCFDLSRMEDEEEFASTKKAMALMGFSAEDQVRSMHTAVMVVL